MRSEEQKLGAFIGKFLQQESHRTSGHVFCGLCGNIN